jgi:hypothetical protein
MDDIAIHTKQETGETEGQIANNTDDWSKKC